MRTTLDLDEDRASGREGTGAVGSTTAGKSCRSWCVKALAPPRTDRVRKGVPLLPRRPPGAQKPTMALVNRLRRGGMSARGATLLDVNVLVALFDPDHVHHQLAHDWFAETRASGWATCAVTEIGFVRVVSQPAYRSPVSRAADLVPLLRRFCSSPDHHFWAETPSNSRRQARESGDLSRVRDS